MGKTFSSYYTPLFTQRYHYRSDTLCLSLKIIQLTMRFLSALTLALVGTLVEGRPVAESGVSCEDGHHIGDFANT